MFSDKTIGKKEVKSFLNLYKVNFEYNDYPRDRVGGCFILGVVHGSRLRKTLNSNKKVDVVGQLLLEDGSQTQVWLFLEKHPAIVDLKKCKNVLGSRKKGQNSWIVKQG